MKNKQNRLNAIRIIIANEEIGSQEELLQKLFKEGYDLTQATLSRDLKLLKVAKTANNDGKYIYILPNHPLYKRISNAKAYRENQIRSGFVSLNFSGNIAVIKTRPGYAGGLAYDIDEREIPCILASIAGDDTILLVIKEGYKSIDLVNALRVIVLELTE